MRILLTGATGYIGKRLLPALVSNGYEVICCVRDKKRFNPPTSMASKIEVIEIDLLDKSSLQKIPKNIDGAYYLVHSMSNSKNYVTLESQSASNFREAMNLTKVKHVVYLSGIINEEALSKHLSSRKNVEEELSRGKYKLTTLRAGIIIGSGSASFEIIRDLVEKLPVMVTPRWLNTRCQPIGVKDVISFLIKTMLNEKGYDKDFDIGGPDILSYKEMLLEFARIRNLKRYIYIVPVMTPRLSSYWLYFVTSTSYNLAIALVNSMKIEVICRDNNWAETLGIKPVSYEESLRRAFSKIQSNEIISSWKDAMSSGTLEMDISDFINVPSFGCFRDQREMKYDDFEATVDRIWRIGGENGWYYGNILWKFRGFLDKLAGGVGLRRGRTSQVELNSGDAVDFWRVLFADKKEGRLLLFAEMKLPGEAWLEFRIKNGMLVQTATFRPVGIMGRIYWYLVYPFHGLIFRGMLKNLVGAE
ncbi:SDR family oxidoreductase [Lutimonas saemankumensis]|uniref:SDR family oxidoreductase n=1 Tax=Lutimonas saemankumensis TaxID=483016 RepID=UPI001CD4BD4E|nr:SDR family oxidoreductase [Lutimonas saemankumensis]MCA0932778.1 SDR family oxidoreductase [Lutimonas saemankumensis]